MPLCFTRTINPPTDRNNVCRDKGDKKMNWKDELKSMQGAHFDLSGDKPETSCAKLEMNETVDRPPVECTGKLQSTERNKEMNPTFNTTVTELKDANSGLSAARAQFLSTLQKQIIETETLLAETVNIECGGDIFSVVKGEIFANINSVNKAIILNSYDYDFIAQCDIELLTEAWLAIRSAIQTALINQAIQAKRTTNDVKNSLDRIRDIA